jgi:D-alanyl-D-alanine-carboxypeptidase/D-alanyl-D-alanine-endopeptidase
MHDTSIAVPAAERERFAQGHSRRGTPVPHWDFDALAPAGAARSTVADLLAFLAAQLDPASSPLSASVELTQRPRAHYAGRMSIGLGWHVLEPDGELHPVHFHNGATGGFRSFAGFVRHTRTAVVVLADSARDVETIALRLLRTIDEP